MTTKSNNPISEKKSTKKTKKIKDVQIGFKMPHDDVNELKQIAEELGGMALASMLRITVYNKLNEVKRTGDPKKFIE